MKFVSFLVVSAFCGVSFSQNLPDLPDLPAAPGVVPGVTGEVIPEDAGSKPKASPASSNRVAEAPPVVKVHPLYSTSKGPDEKGFVWREVVPGFWRKLPADSPSVNAPCLNPEVQLQGLLTQKDADSIRVMAEAVGGQPKDASGREIPLPPPLPAKEVVAPPPYHSYFAFLVVEKHVLMLPKTSVLDVPETLASSLLSYEAVSAKDAPVREMVTSFPGPFVQVVRAVPVKLNEAGTYVVKGSELAALKSPNLILVAVSDGVPVESEVKVIE